MVYNKRRERWKNLPSLETPVMAEDIEHWEDGISRAHEIAEDAAAAAEEARQAAASAVTLPSGGANGQVLAKSGDGLAWANPPTGGGIFLDADGVPYFDPTATGGGSIALDADGVPYVTGV